MMRSCMQTFRDELIGHMPAMRAFARTLCGDAARTDDLTQDAVLRAWAKRDSFTPGTNMRAWLFTILRNGYFSQLRRRHLEVADPEGRRAAAVVVPASQQEGLKMRDLRRALAELPPSQREAIILVGAGARSYEEAAAISGCAVGTMKSRVSRARRALFRFGIDVGARDAV
ncbi:MAG: sigma-70 family RNA polymerase sigma factor [Alphaproteobacteria bacterium]|nr:sigma-70 family RNA polymerase sigma factor [Alphaproteobacteria bacterium]